MVRYPHTLSLSWETGGGLNASGYYDAGTTAMHSIPGRAEANSKGALIGLTDGSQIAYSWEYYCRPQLFEAPYGCDAQLLEGTAVVWEGTLKRHVNNQKGAKIWL